MSFIARIVALVLTKILVPILDFAKLRIDVFHPFESGSLLEKCAKKVKIFKKKFFFGDFLFQNKVIRCLRTI